MGGDDFVLGADLLALSISSNLLQSSPNVPISPQRGSNFGPPGMDMLSAFALKNEFLLG